ncbi:TetR/AcrR family transcriptional regulator [Actinomadura flavalba]|uniref:TetR/AcrR family transcriptional regulator n=1 Tax=Actinomadura flavalba TaxID=1120938 RepID=UPI00037D53F2|nr:TetR/AcrR family transcriptional regulator C-terminal domain-containing protein [Actinomadura flavalba]
MVRQPSINAQNRPPLSIDRITDAALSIVDGQGLGRLTMRRLGDALEVEAMAIYHHLPRGKEQLLDHLVAHVAVLPASEGDATGWRDALHRWAVAYRARLLTHQGVLPLLVTRRNPAALTTTTASLLELMRGGGVPEDTARVAAHVLLGFVLGHAALEVRGTPAFPGDSVGTPGEAPIDWDARFAAGLDQALAGVNPG